MQTLFLSCHLQQSPQSERGAQWFLRLPPTMLLLCGATFRCCCSWGVLGGAQQSQGVCQIKFRVHDEVVPLHPGRPLVCQPSLQVFVEEACLRLHFNFSKLGGFPLALEGAAPSSVDVKQGLVISQVKKNASFFELVCNGATLTCIWF